MCGITGFWLSSSCADDAARAALVRMSDAIAHRGPDDSDHHWESETGVGLSHRRLSIVDLSPDGRQPMVSASGHFVVNLLAEDQAHLGNRFAGKLDNQFDGIGYTLSDRGAPIIDGAVATLECETVGATDFGTHTIFIGKVLKGTRSEVLPLLYHDGGYKGITRRG